MMQSRAPTGQPYASRMGSFEWLLARFDINDLHKETWGPLMLCGSQALRTGRGISSTPGNPTINTTAYFHVGLEELRAKFARCPVQGLNYFSETK